MDGQDALGTEYPISLNASAVEKWFGVTNNGIRLIKGESYFNTQFASSARLTAAHRPRLVVVYTEGGGASIAPHAMHYARLRRSA